MDFVAAWRMTGVIHQRAMTMSRWAFMPMDFPWLRMNVSRGVGPARQWQGEMDHERGLINEVDFTVAYQ